MQKESVHTGFVVLFLLLFSVNCLLSLFHFCAGGGWSVWLVGWFGWLVWLAGLVGWFAGWEREERGQGTFMSWFLHLYRRPFLGLTGMRGRYCVALRFLLKKSREGKRRAFYVF